MQIRKERPEDAGAIEAITTEAFENAPHRGGNEARIVEALRHSGGLALSLVASDDHGAPIGHVAFSPVRIDERPGGWFALGPISVRSGRQRSGIGGALIREGLARLGGVSAQGCVLLGDPAYYGRFGFVGGDALTYFRHPNPYLQWLVLGGPCPHGDVTFHPAFDVA